MPFLAAVAVIALSSFQAEWPPATGYVNTGSARTPSLKSQVMDVPDPNDPTKKIKVEVYTTVGWMIDSIVDNPPAEKPIVARTIRLTSGNQSEEVELRTEATVLNKDGIALGVHFALTDLGIEPGPHMEGIMSRLREWENLPEASGMITPTKFTVTWNPYAEDNPKAIVEHDVGYIESEFKMTFTIERRYKIGDKIYGLPQISIPNETMRVMKFAKNAPLATRVIIPDEKAAEDNRTGFFSCPSQDDEMAGVSYAGGGWAGLVNWPGGEVWSADLKIGGFEVGDYWAGFAGGSTEGAVFTGDGMNAINFNPGAISAGLGTIAMPDEMYLPGGTLFVPSDPEFQILMAGQNICYRREGAGSLLASITPQLSDNKGFTLCAQMSKKEPNSKVNYFPVAPPNSVFSALAKISAEAIFKGPAEQARLWIYTDKASFSGINFRLIPGITARQYVNCLYEINHVGGLTGKDMMNAKLFEPRLLGASGLSPKTASWFYDHLATTWPKEAAAELTKPGKELTKLVAAGGKPEDLKAAALMTAYMLEYGGPELRSATLTFLMGVPQENVTALAAFKPLKGGVVQAAGSAEERALYAQVKARYGG